jgi:hypothetical protein
MAVTGTSPPPSRWTLRTIRVSVDILHDLTLSGAWRALKRCRVDLRSGVVQQYSPDPDYMHNRDNLFKCMEDAATAPDRVALVFLDEMGYARWPDPACDWTGRAPAAPPLADRAESPNRSRSQPGGCQFRMRPLSSSHGANASAPRPVMECGLA